nr:hypothetical protein [Tanacetum cinerariifolium]GFB72706.1 hypothetical protein [Tanacetum cinerariifolium]
MMVMVAGSSGGCCGWQLGVVVWCCWQRRGMVGGSGCCHGDLVAATMVWLEVAAGGSYEGGGSG